MHPHLAKLVGLDGPDMAVTIAAYEIELLRKMVADLPPALEGALRARCDRVLRDLDVQLGALGELAVGRGAGDVTLVAIDPDGVKEMRRAAEATRSYHGISPTLADVDRLLRELDRRLGAAQAAAARYAEQHPPGPDRTVEVGELEHIPRQTRPARSPWGRWPRINRRGGAQ